MAGVMEVDDPVLSNSTTILNENNVIDSGEPAHEGVVSSNGNAERTIPVPDDTLHDYEEDDSEVVVVAVKRKRDGHLVLSQNAALGDEGAINVTVRRGYIKEIITSKGLGILFSMSSGPVLFHAEHMFVDGESLRSFAREDRDRLVRPETEVSFIEMYIHGPEFSCLSPQGFMRQAAAVWIGPRPEHLLKWAESEAHRKQMAIHREMFLALVRDEAFLPAHVVRASGKIAGYISSRFGIIEADSLEVGGEDKSGVTRAVFCADDAYIFRRPAIEMMEHGQAAISDLLPPGLSVRFDARRMEPYADAEVSLQALCVFAGNWPRLPHPTLLPGGPGSIVRSYERETAPRNHTFYYLDMSMESSFDTKWSKFIAVANDVNNYTYTRFIICNRESYLNWRESFAPPYLQRQAVRREPQRNYHLFWKPTPSADHDQHMVKMEPAKIKTEEEF